MRHVALGACLHGALQKLCFDQRSTSSRSASPPLQAPFPAQILHSFRSCCTLPWQLASLRQPLQCPFGRGCRCTFHFLVCRWHIWKGRTYCNRHKGNGASCGAVEDFDCLPSYEFSGGAGGNCNKFGGGWGGQKQHIDHGGERRWLGALALMRTLLSGARGVAAAGAALGSICRTS